MIPVTNATELLLSTPEGFEMFKARIAEICFELKPHLRGSTLDFSCDAIRLLARRIDHQIAAQRHGGETEGRLGQIVTRAIRTEVAAFLEIHASAAAGLN